MTTDTQTTITHTADHTLTDREHAQLSYALRLEQDGILDPTDGTLDRLRAIAKLYHQAEELAAKVDSLLPQSAPDPATNPAPVPAKPRGRPRKPRSASPASQALSDMAEASVGAGNGTQGQESGQP